MKRLRQEQFERYMNNNLRNMERLVAERKEEQKKRERWNMFRWPDIGYNRYRSYCCVVQQRKKQKSAQEEAKPDRRSKSKRISSVQERIVLYLVTNGRFSSMS